jgi:hypothetical protein
VVENKSQRLAPAPEHIKDNNDPMHFVRVYGNWRIERHTPVDGQLSLAEVREGRNVITTAGKEALASLLNAAAATATTNTFKYLAIGTGVAAESAADTTLGTELTRNTGTVSYITGAIYQVKATFATGIGTGAITEYGLFNSSTAGTMFSRDLETVINKGALDVLTATLQITLS